MKIYEVTNQHSDDSLVIHKGVDLIKQPEVSQDSLVVALGQSVFIQLHRTEPHVDRLTHHEDQRLNSAHPVFKLESGDLELASDILREDNNRVMVVIRGLEPVPWNLTFRVGSGGEGILNSDIARNAIGESLLIAQSEPTRNEDAIRDSIWIMSVGQGIRLNDMYTLFFEAGELKIERSAEWLSAQRNNAKHTDEVWV